MNESPNSVIERAIELAVVSHTGQVDKSGEAYILHPLRVMAAVRDKGGNFDQQAAAVMHDIVEDCDVSLEALSLRFSPEICDLVDALTRREGEEYDAFWHRTADTPGALVIKEADIRNNQGRLEMIQDEATRTRLDEKYAAALDLLREIR